MIQWISFEGGEGTGKTTLIESLAEYFLSQNREVLVTREPGGVPIAEQIRSVILDSGEMDALTEALLFAASRRQHLVEKITPALKAGKLVLMDRYVDSSVVYQGYARGLGMEKVLQLNNIAIENRLPDLTILIDLDPKIGFSRIQRNQRQTNRLDNESISFHEKVRQGYLLWAKQTSRIKVIDGNKSPAELLREVITLIENE